MSSESGEDISSICLIPTTYVLGVKSTPRVLFTPGTLEVPVPCVSFTPVTLEVWNQFHVSYSHQVCWRCEINSMCLIYTRYAGGVKSNPCILFTPGVKSVPCILFTPGTLEVWNQAHVFYSHQVRSKCPRSPRKISTKWSTSARSKRTLPTCAWWTCTGLPFWTTRTSRCWPPTASTSSVSPSTSASGSRAPPSKLSSSDARNSNLCCYNTQVRIIVLFVFRAVEDNRVIMCQRRKSEWLLVRLTKQGAGGGGWGVGVGWGGGRIREKFSLIDNETER